MQDETSTGFLDKTGRTIYVGDIVQHRLGKYGMSGGSKNFKVIQFGKGFHLVNESHTDERYGGTRLTQKMCENLVVIKSGRMRL